MCLSEIDCIVVSVIKSLHLWFPCVLVSLCYNWAVIDSCWFLMVYYSEFFWEIEESLFWKFVNGTSDLYSSVSTDKGNEWIIVSLFPP